MGIYARSFVIIILLSTLNGIQVFGQKTKKNKKNKKQVELPKPVMSNQLDSVSYALGMGMAENLKNSGMDSLSYEAFHKGLLSIFNGDSSLLQKEEVQDILQSYFTAMAEKVAEENLAEGTAFLEKNKLRPEVKTTASGLQYEVILEGEGPNANMDSQVTVNYEGKLINGFIFDSSYERNEAIQFSLTQVIAGWTEGLQLMNPGSKYIFYIPSELAWGPRGSGADIPPNATVIFTVELISVDN